MSKTEGNLALKDDSVANDADRHGNPPAGAISAEAVADYLRGHPEFFQDRDDLVADLQLPGPPPEIASLPHRQLSIWRQRHHRLGSRLEQIIQTAEENARHDAQMHELVCDWLPQVGRADAVARFLELLKARFSLDAACYRPWSALDETQRRCFERFVEARYPSCGRITDEQRKVLFADAMPETGSAALIPVGDAGAPLLGLLALGRHAPDGFRPDQGTVFLAQIGELLAAGLRNAA
ncbi:MAG: DUF484 family protein [Halothiobacillaceae bacterium]